MRPSWKTTCTDSQHLCSDLPISTATPHTLPYTLTIKDKVSMLLRSQSMPTLPSPSPYGLFRHCSSISSVSLKSLTSYTIMVHSFIICPYLFIIKNLTCGPSLAMVPFLFSLCRKSLHYLHFLLFSLKLTRVSPPASSYT